MVAAVLVALGLALGLAMVASGAGGGGAAIYATGTALTGLLFAAVGAASGQLLGERRAATGLAAGLLLVGLLVRMVADGIESLAWASWLTPFGLLSLSAPYADDRWAPLGVLALGAVAVGGAAWVMAGRRDVGSGLLHRSAGSTAAAPARCPASGASLSAGRCRHSSAGRWRWPRTSC